MELKYKILIPVLAQVEDFSNLLDQCPDKSKLILVNNLDNPEVTSLCKEAQKQGAEIHHFPGNKGCAASWNIGLQEVMAGRLDYLIILSPSCRWNNNVLDFVNAIEKQEAIEPQDFYTAIGQHITDTHAFAVMKNLVDQIGLFDENFHPVYLEDTDYVYRQKLIGSHRFEITGLRTSAPLNGGVKKDPRVWEQYIRSAQRLKDYYISKWGGEPGSEKWKRPFGDATHSLFTWPMPKKLVPLPTLQQLEDEGRL